MEYLINLGMPEERIWTGYDVVDNEHFREGAQRARAKATFLREELDLPEHYFLTCARFIDVKNLTGLVLAYAHYVVDCGTQPWGLVLVGDGPLRGEIWALVQNLGLEDLIRLPGYKDYEELPAYYGLADVFVLPSSSETWGLVVNEAMAAGLPVLVSEKCGCAPDLVREGVNGFTVDPGGVGQLATQMWEMASESCDRTAMGRASEKIVSRWTLETFAQGLHGTLECAGQAPIKKPGVLDSMILRVLEPK
ncbi:glycosyltransferase [Thioalbus denitrificans]|nr:glycosyltransferase [Thioalbus denitrificans]